MTGQSIHTELTVGMGSLGNVGTSVAIKNELVAGFANRGAVMIAKQITRQAHEMIHWIWLWALAAIAVSVLQARVLGQHGQPSESPHRISILSFLSWLVVSIDCMC